MKTSFLRKVTSSNRSGQTLLHLALLPVSLDGLLFIPGWTAGHHRGAFLSHGDFACGAAHDAP